MLERYVLPDYITAEREFVPGMSWWNFAPKYNVAPGQYVPSIRMHDGRPEGMMMRWGLIPEWAENKPPPEPTTSVDMDLLEGSKIFGTPWAEGQRCIMPMAGFYTWRLNRYRFRQPYYVQLNNRNVFGLAAVWDRSEGGEEEVTESCAAVTLGANELLAKVLTPPARMPAILRRKDYEAWLKGSVAEARAALQTYNAAWMAAHPVSPRINSPTADDIELISPVEPAQGR